MRTETGLAGIHRKPVYMAAAIDRLGINGHPVQESDLAYLSPCWYGHINPYGKYDFDVSDSLRGASSDRSGQVVSRLSVVFCPFAMGRP